MRLLILLFSGMLGFLTIVGMVVVAFGVAMTGGFGRNDLAVVKEGMGKAYVSGLKGVEQTARRLRGDYCAQERPEERTREQPREPAGTKNANCG